MIKNLNEIKKHTDKYISDFIKNCIIEEKIDTHYISVEIISKNEIKIRKANGNEIDRVDMILNSMWNPLSVDWNYLKLSNRMWFENHVGFTITMFYFPCTKPILTEYKPKLRYIFDRAIFNNILYDIKEVMSDMIFPNSYEIGYKKTLNKIDDVTPVISAVMAEKDEDLASIFMQLIKDPEEMYALNMEPEGIIYKWNKKIYQTGNPKERKIEAEKTSYEFLLCDFIQYCKNRAYSEKITPSYTKTICNLFNDYIINWESKNNTIQKNINVESIESPNLGAPFDMGYEYIPDPVTKNLCNNLLYKNIFKVLLANLRKGKDSRHCIYMNKKQVDEWNNIMKNIKIHTIYI